MTPAPRHIALIQGHPDAARGGFCHALADAYAAGARDAGHTVDIVEIGQVEFPLIRGRADFQRDTPEPIRRVQDVLKRSDHVVLFYPIWNGTAPALVRGFLEQTFRSTFVFPDTKPGERLGFRSYFSQRKGLSGRSARVVATMQMPGFVYRWYFHPHPERNTLALSGLKPVRETRVGRVDAPDGRVRARWLRRMRALGGRAM
jgi:putative NADPH-quinone reductase